MYLLLFIHVFFRYPTRTQAHHFVIQTYAVIERIAMEREKRIRSAKMIRCICKSVILRVLLICRHLITSIPFGGVVERSWFFICKATSFRSIDSASISSTQSVHYSRRNWKVPKLNEGEPTATAKKVSANFINKRSLCLLSFSQSLFLPDKNCNFFLLFNNVCVCVCVPGVNRDKQKKSPSL